MQAGVSISAVSRILAGKKADTFAKDTVKRVKDAAEQLRYRPNRLVRGMQTGQTGLVGGVIPAYYDFYGLVMAGIHDLLVEHDRHPVVLWSEADSYTQKGRAELEQIHALVDLRVEGIILKPIFEAASDQCLHEIIDRNIPLVVVDRALPRVHACFVGSDDEGGMALTLEFLKSLGHRSILYFGPATTVTTGLHRLQAFRAFMSQESELQAHEFLTKDWTPQSKDASAFLRQTPSVTAVVAVNDNFAHAACQAAEELGISVPQDLSVMGYGNLGFSSFMSPALTTVDQHPYEIGRAAGTRLMSRINNPSESSRKIFLPPDLIVRDSTGPVAQERPMGSPGS